MGKPTIMIQARTGSQRFPKKVLANIEGKPLLWHVINRLKHVHGIEQIILITTSTKEDKTLMDIAEMSKIKVFAGDETNVLNRHYQCAKKFEVDPIIRITADCPLIDPEVVDKILSQYKTGKYDFCSNCLPYTFPDGLDTEIFSFQVLEKMIKNVKSDLEKEHVTVYIRNHLKEFRIFNFENDEDFSKFRWTVDFSADLEVVKRIYELMKPKDVFSFQEVFKKISQLDLNLKDFGLKD